MSAQAPPLPPGWHAQWDPNANRYAFVDSATGQAQWNHPSAGPPPGQGQPHPQLRRHASRPSLSSPAPQPQPNHQQQQQPPPPGHQQQALQPQQQGLRPQTSQHQLRHQPSFNMSAPPPPGGQPPLPGGGFDRVGSPNNGFTSPPLPALPSQSVSPQLGSAPVARGSRRQYAANTAVYGAVDATGAGVGGQAAQGGQFNGQQQQQPAGYPQQEQQPAFFSPGDPQGQQYGGAQGGYPDQGAHGGHQGGAYAGGQAAYAGVGQQTMAGMNQQFGSMGLGGGTQGPQTVNLVGMQLNPAELATLQPPPIKLPPQASFTDHPLRNADPSYQRSTLTAIPATPALLSKSKVPLALVITPYRSVRADEPEVPVQTDTCIARCRRCRMYINPFVTFIEGGARWKCCVCGLANAVPQLFDWNQETNEPVDRYLRPELSHAVVDYVAPTEYMIRPPQPPMFVFLIDVSYAAITSGMVATAARTLLESLDRIPDDDGRTKVAVIGVDSCLHFFTLPAGPTGEPTTLVVGDLDDVFLPKPNDILVSLVEAKAAVENLLARLSDMYKDTANVGHALGPALQAAFKLLSNVGGKVVALSATLPNLGPGALKDRTDPKLLGTTKESGLLQAANAWYKTFAIECSRAQISVDLWLFSSAYTDVATLSGLPRYTGGNTYYYPSFNASRSEDALKFAHEFGTVLSDPTPFEAVIRVRASKGLRLSAFHGNFFVRSTDLLSLPSVPMDQSYAIELTIDDPIAAPFVVLQTGIMHTTAFGERRIRVITQALPVTSSMSELYAGVDAVALATLYANKAIERTLQSKMEDAREAVVNKLVDILGTYKSTMLGGGKGPSPQLVVAENMKFLPILMLGLLKNLSLRQSAMIPPDIRAYAQSLLTTLPSQLLIPYLHPTLYALHTMPSEAGTIGEHGVILPPPLPLTTERFERHGLFLVENGQEIFLWVGSAAVPQLVQDVFGVDDYAQLKAGKATLRPETEFGRRVAAVVGKCREMRRGPYWPHLFVVKETGDPAMAGWFLSLLVEDRQEGLPTYAQFLGQLKERVNEGKF